MDALKNKLNFIFTIALMACATIFYAQDNTAYSLPQCIDMAIQNNFALATAQSQLEAGEARLQQSEAYLLPSVNGYANQGINAGKSINPYTNTFINQEIGTGQYGLNASLNLFSGLNTVNSIAQSATSHKADKMDYEQAKLDLSIQVTQAYLQILSNEELVSQANFQMELTRAQLDRLQVLDKNNAISPQVLYDTKGQLSNDQLNLITVRTNLLSAKITLAQLLNIKLKPNAVFEKINSVIDTNDSLLKVEDIYASLQPKAPLIKSADYRKTSALKGLHASRGLAFPSLSLVGNIGSNYSSAAQTQKISGINTIQSSDYISISGTDYSVYQPQYTYNNEKIQFNNQLKNNLNTYIGLSLQVPIFNSLKTKTQSKLGKINYHQAQYQVKNVETRFRTLIEQTCNELSSAYERYQIYQQQVNDYTNSFNIAQIKFEQGSITTIEFMTTKNNLEKAKVGLITSRYDYLLKKEVLNLYDKQ